MRAGGNAPTRDVVVIGAGVAGLATAIGLARTGCRVTVLDRDPPPPTDDPEEAFVSWPRSGVPQARQPHGFWARSRNLLARHTPDVLDRLAAIGVGRWNILDLAPPELRIPEDEQFSSLLVRRLPFELVLRQFAAAEPAVDLRQGSVVAGLLFDDANGSRPPRVTGVGLRGGDTVIADLVIDAGGRRTPVPERLAERGAVLPVQSQPCDMTYFGRHYRQHDHSDLDRDTLVRPTGDLGYLQYGTFLADNGTLGMFLGSAAWDKTFRALRHDEVWEAAIRSIPGLAPWIDPAHSTPLTDVQPMAGQQNVLRRFVVDGQPLALGVLAVGDALCTTNPAFGWGASLALTHAFAAVEAIAAERGLEAVALAYDEAVMPEVEQYYRASAAQDRLRTYRWRGEPVPEEDREEADRQQLLDEGLQPAMQRDMHVLRAMLRRSTLIDPPDAIWDDEHAIRVAREVAAWRAEHRPAAARGPSRPELLELLAAAGTPDGVEVSVE